MGKLLEKLGTLGVGAQAGVALTLLGLVCGAYFYWLYLPKQAELEKARQKLQGLEQKVAESRRAVAELPRFKEEVLRLNQELLVAMAQLPETKDIPDLLAGVSRVGQDSGLEVLVFRPGAEASQGLYASIPVQLRVTGTFHQLLTFFDRVSRMPRIVTIGDVSMTEPKETNGRLVLAAGFNATTYRLLPEGAAQPAQRPGQTSPRGVRPRGR